MHIYQQIQNGKEENNYYCSKYKTDLFFLIFQNVKESERE